MPDQTLLFAKTALLPDGWARDVAIDVDGDGRIASVRTGAAPEGRESVRGPVVPALADLHSHAFQRAMAGLAEVSGTGEDSFWTWRETMYRLVARVTPEDVEAVAARLYVDLLKGGFGAVGEFHYLHHAPGGAPYADSAEMSRRILAAAERSGIGLTLLPVFYAHSDFGGAPPGEAQKRFVHGVDDYLALLEMLGPAARAAGATLGVSFHSLRAATPDEMRAILAAAPGDVPVHIHAAEQQREVEACLAWSGRRPVEFLLGKIGADRRWCLVHATHMSEGEIAGLAASGTVASLCPTTEANLGDGIFSAVAFQAAGGRFGIGTDSHVSTGVAEELRLLEYGQRLRDGRRTRLAGGPGRSVGRTLFESAAAGGGEALGQAIGAIAPGHVASFAVLDGDDPFIANAEGDAILDRWIFALGDTAVRDVMVAGRWRIRDRRHEREREIDAAFARAIARLS